ncbi:hypothetical protein ACWCOW_38140 [Streptomyces sp. NPDC001939]
MGARHPRAAGIAVNGDGPGGIFSFAGAVTAIVLLSQPSAVT